MAGRGTDIQLRGNKDFRGGKKELDEIKEDESKVKIGGFILLELKDMRVEE